MRCPSCGADNVNDARFCAYCRSELPKPVAPPPPQTVTINHYYEAPTAQVHPAAQMQYIPQTSHRSRWIALALWLFLGPFGGHQFYAGKVGMGFLYLFTAGLFGIGWLIDLPIILFGRFRDRNGLPLR